MKVLDRAAIKLGTPGSEVRHASVAILTSVDSANLYSLLLYLETPN